MMDQLGWGLEMGNDEREKLYWLGWVCLRERECVQSSSAAMVVMGISNCVFVRHAARLLISP